eukprot:9498612-Pyramimonas_sp.AAC.1
MDGPPRQTRRTISSTEIMSKMEDGGRSCSAPEIYDDVAGKTKPRIRRVTSGAALKATMTAFSPYCKCSAGPPHHLHETVDRLVKFEEVLRTSDFHSFRTMQTIITYSVSLCLTSLLSNRLLRRKTA